MATCPACGRVLRPGLRRVPDDAGERSRYQFTTSDEPPDEDSQTTWHEHRQPARQASVASDVATPALQSVVSALAAGGVAVAPVAWLDLSWWLPPALASATFAVVWWRLLSDTRRHLWQVDVYERERELPLPAPRTTTRLSVMTAPNSVSERELPVDPDALRRVAQALSTGGVAFSERELAGRGKLLDGRADYVELRDALLAFGWLRWKSDDKRQGVELTAPGRAGLRALADGRASAEGVVA